MNRRSLPRIDSTCAGYPNSRLPIPLKIYLNALESVSSDLVFPDDLIRVGRALAMHQWRHGCNARTCAASSVAAFVTKWNEWEAAYGGKIKIIKRRARHQ